MSRNEKHWFYNCCCLVAKSCLTLWDPMDYSPLGSSVRGISQARILEWVTISSLGDLPDLGIESKLSYCVLTTGGFPDSSVGKESTCSAGDPGPIPGSGRSAGEGIGYPLQYSWASLVAQLVKNPPAMQEIWVRSVGSIPVLERSPGEGDGYPLQYSVLENSMDCKVRGVTTSWT